MVDTSPSSVSTHHTLVVGFSVFTRYGMAGAIGTAAHYGVLWSIVSLVDPVLATTLGAIVGCLTNFLLAHIFVFSSAKPVTATLPKFLAVACVGIAINALVVSIASPIFPLLVSQLAATACVLTLGFLLNRYWTFDE